jgi:hypothetical protein
VTQLSVVPSSAVPMNAPMTSCATVPTTISEEGGRDAQSDRNQRGGEREPEPQRRAQPDLGHDGRHPVRSRAETNAD